MLFMVFCWSARLAALNQGCDSKYALTAAWSLDISPSPAIIFWFLVSINVLLVAFNAAASAPNFQKFHKSNC